MGRESQRSFNNDGRGRNTVGALFEQGGWDIDGDDPNLILGCNRAHDVDASICFVVVVCVCVCVYQIFKTRPTNLSARRQSGTWVPSTIHINLKI